MKNITGETLKGATQEVDIEQIFQNVEMVEQTEQMETAEAREQVRSLELKLREIQATHENKEKAQQEAKETQAEVSAIAG